MGRIQLSDAIENLRKELKLAQDKGKDQYLRFDISSIEIELEVVAESEVGTSGKINWWVLGGAIDSKDKDVSKHKLKLTLQAIEVSKDGNSEKRIQVAQDQSEFAE